MPRPDARAPKRVLVGLSLAVLSTAVLAGCGSSPGVPRISLQGIGGVRPDTPLRTVRQKWHLMLPAAVQAGSEATVYAPVCTGKIRGIAEFEGATPQQATEVPFNWAGIGSSAAAVRRVYGHRLLGDLRHGDFRIISARPPRTTIIFAFDDGDRVTAIGYGRRGAVDMYDWRASC